MSSWHITPIAPPTGCGFRPVPNKGERGNDGNDYLLSVCKNDTWDKKLGSLLTEGWLSVQRLKDVLKACNYTLHPIVRKHEQSEKTKTTQGDKQFLHKNFHGYKWLHGEPHQRWELNICMMIVDICKWSKHTPIYLHFEKSILYTHAPANGQKKLSYILSTKDELFCRLGLVVVILMIVPWELEW